MSQEFPAQAAWERARDRYVKDLTEDEKYIYSQASLQEIMKDAHMAVNEHGASSRGRKFASHLQPFVDAIDQYGKVLDVISNVYPIITSPLWGSIRVVLHLAREFGKYFEKIVDMFVRIGDVLPRFEVYERLFPNHERLLEALVLIYVDILRFCSDAKSIFRRGRHPSVRIAFKLIWKPFNAQFGLQLSTFRDHQKRVEKEARVSDMIEAADARSQALTERRDREEGRRKKNRLRMLDSLSTVRYEDKKRKLQKLRHRDTGKWLLYHEVYLKWKSFSGFSGLCCRGIPGSGKSILTSTIIEDLLGSKTNDLQSKAVYYFCDYADQTTLQPERIFGTLIKQLLLQDLVPEEIERKIAQAYENSLMMPMEEDLKGHLQAIICSCPSLYVIIDGLDECDPQSRKSVLDFLEHITSKRIKVFVTCRDEDEIIRSLNHFNQIQISSGMAAADIESFIAHSIQHLMETQELRIRSEALRSEVVGELSAKAQGMFLWVYFQLNDLCNTSSDAEIRDVLSNLPGGLGETYARILRRIVKDSRKRKMARKVFQWASCAKRPLHIDEMREAVAFSEHDERWDIEKIPDGDSVIEACQGLVIREVDDQTLRFAHHTVQQFLVRSESKLEVFDVDPEMNLKMKQLEAFMFPMALAEREAGNLCIGYLSFSDFETALTERKGTERNGMLGPSGLRLMPAVLGLSKPLFSLSYRLFGGDSNVKIPDVDFSRDFIWKKRPPADMSKKYALLNYVIDNWMLHTMSLDVEQISPKFRRLVLHKTLPFEFRPWGSNQHFGPYGCQSCPIPDPSEPEPQAKDLPFMALFHWATEAGHFPLLSLERLRETYCFHERYRNETFLIACRAGRLDVVKFLAQDTNTVAISDGRAITAACSAGHRPIVEFLLSLGRYNVRTKENELLLLTITKGHASVVQLLLEEGVQRDVADRETGETPLHIAAATGSEKIVEVLVNSPVLEGSSLSAFFDAKDNYNETALMKAATNGHSRVVEILVGVGADIHVKTAPHPLLPGQSPDTRNYDECDAANALHLAAASGHAEVLELLYNKMKVKEMGVSFEYQHCCGTLRMTALHWAVVSGSLPTVKVCLVFGADIEALTTGGSLVMDWRRFYGWKGVHFAAYYNYPVILEELAKAGAEIHSPAHDAHTTPLHIAAKFGWTEILQVLLNHSVDIDMNDNYGDPAIHLAIRYGHLAFLNALLNADAYLSWYRFVDYFSYYSSLRSERNLKPESMRCIDFLLSLPPDHKAAPGISDIDKMLEALKGAKRLRGEFMTLKDSLERRKAYLLRVERDRSHFSPDMNVLNWIGDDNDDDIQRQQRRRRR